MSERTRAHGMVYLVGAGPGDPRLLTRHAFDLLQTCDVIAYDALISPSILALCSPSAEFLSVGYRGYGSKQLGYRLHPEIVKFASRGKIVVRLKSGDPLVFGRAGQECEELNERGIPFEIVPGVTSALAATAYIGVPLTHRDFSSDVILTSGHDLRGGSPSNSNWEALGKSTGTIAIYMAASKIHENCARLIEAGRDPNTPAALISNATRGNQKVWRATLSTLAEKVGRVEKGIPALILAGQTVGLHQTLAWLDKKPLSGLTLLVVRARRGRSALSDLLRDQGADVVEAPRIMQEHNEESSCSGERIPSLSTYRNLIFSCVEGVEAFFKQLLLDHRDARDLRGIRIVAMDKRIALRLREFAIDPDRVLEGHCSEALVQQREILSDGPNLVITSNRGRPHLEEAFMVFKTSTDFAKIYSVAHRFPAIPAPQVDTTILPSSTSARILLEGPWRDAFLHTPLVAFGPETETTARELGATQIFRTAEDRPEAVVALIRQFKKEREGAKNDG